MHRKEHHFELFRSQILQNDVSFGALHSRRNKRGVGEAIWGEATEVYPISIDSHHTTKKGSYDIGKCKLSFVFFLVIIVMIYYVEGGMIHGTTLYNPTVFRSV